MKRDRFFQLSGILIWALCLAFSAKAARAEDIAIDFDGKVDVKPLLNRAEAAANSDHRRLSAASVEPSQRNVSEDVFERCFADTYGAGKMPREKAAEFCRGARADAPARCYAKAYDSYPRLLGSDGAMQLCRGAWTDAPARCFDKAYQSAPSLLGGDGAMQLCRGALSEAPVQCFERAYGDYPSLLGKDGAMKLCRGTWTDAPARCFDRAYQAYPSLLGPNGAADLCLGAWSEAPAECFDEAYKASPSQLGAQGAIELCKPKAVSQAAGLQKTQSAK